MSLLFFTAADLRYEHYVAPYVTSALVNNPDACAEICVEAGYVERYAAAIAVLDRHFPGRVRFRGSDLFGQVQPAMVRFLEQPLGQAASVYIGDIDILITEAVAPPHLAFMARTGLPYSNMYRADWAEKGKPKLTGLHFSRWDAYYPVAVPDGVRISERAWGYDEELLYHLVASRGIEIDTTSKFRPVHGLHLSQHGYPLNPRHGWGIRQPALRAAYRILRSTRAWNDLRPVVGDRFKVMVDMLDAADLALDAYGDDAFKIYALVGTV